MPMDMTISVLYLCGVVCRHISVGFLLCILLGGQCEGLELRICNSRSTLFLCAHMRATSFENAARR